ncbi:DUF3977 family protein [Paenibacillus tundrae]|uniref:DUF3977 domain-containing protein n=1 Tax=Paenibacillus tundrae TaxID=528187 RepID=A0ABT9WA27_9BACL|nr:DUF3977 family protein [Paenibacillus tundrae]MDQ0170109.1 hypothetical protein [Paenibacillus tundrae]
MKKYIEIGFGNTWFIRTELEHEDGTETEIKGIYSPFQLKSIYIRVWFGKRVFIMDTREGMKLAKKDKKKYKLILGFYGI